MHPLEFPKVRFEPLHPDVEIPTRSSAWSAGYDVRAYLRDEAPLEVRTEYNESVDGNAYGNDAVFRIVLRPGERALIPLGFKAQIDLGYEAQVRPRSGLAWNHALEIVNAPGTIDADYPGEWKVLVRNGSKVPLWIEHGQKIAQVVFAKMEVVAFMTGQAVQPVTNRIGGFGSTGA